MASKKRKQTPQSSTLLDFFGKGSQASGLRETKKARFKGAVSGSKAGAKRATLPVEIIVIDSDEDEHDQACTRPRPTAKPLQPSAKVPALGGNKEEQEGVASISKDIRANAKPEPANGSLDDIFPASHNTSQDAREPSPFGIPHLLIERSDKQCEPVPTNKHISVVQVCSQDEQNEDQVAPLKAKPMDLGTRETEGSSRDVVDWDMGDDEIEFVDVDTKVKREITGEVDIDLTVDEDVLSEPGWEGAPSCPICEKELVGTSSLQIQNHVDVCIEASPGVNSFPYTPSVPSSSKTLVPLSSLLAPQPPNVNDATSDAIKQECGDESVFSKLMTSYKENEAWKEASTVENRNFRPTKSNRRKAPFYKVLQGMPIAVDAFRYGTIPNVTAYFLTHAHSDHYTNLSSNWKSGPIYCSHGTANLIIHMLNVDPKWVVPLPMDVPTTVPNTGGVQVTLIEANHCPGSCLFLFEGKQTVDAGDSAYKSSYVGSSKVFRYLHCGDFRACPQHVLHPAVKGKHIDHVYLDTTYLDPKYCFPPQPLVISACAELAKRLVLGHADSAEEEGDEKKPRTMTGWFTRLDKGDKGKEKAKASSSPDKVLVVIGTYSIGKERVVKAVAKALGTKVYCDSRKAAILRCESDPELEALLSTDPATAGVHLVPLGVVSTDRLKQYADRWKGQYTKVVGFRPTGWTFTAPNGSDTLPAISTVIERSQSRTFTHANLQPVRNSTATLQLYGVPYSEHSSFFELSCFALSLDWGRMIATVNVGSETSRGKMAKWVERWEAERKKRGGAKMVDFRAEDYW